MNQFNLMWFGDESTPSPSQIAAEAENTAATEVGSQTPVAEESDLPSVSLAEDADTPSKEEKGDYKAFKEQFKKEYQADLQRIIDKRFKNAKKVEAQRDELLAQTKKYDTLLATLSETYGTDDVEQLVSRLTQQPAATRQSESEENAPSEEEAAPEEAEQLQKEIVENWRQEATDLQEIYPAFSLEEEIDNEKFAQGLQSGMSMRDAYQYAHFDEILAGVIRYTAEGVKNSVQANKALRAERPAENGTHAGAAAVVKNDVSKLTKQEMEDIDKRVLRGERIIF